MVQRRVGVFGGTFDPVHVGHLIVATELRFALALDCVLFVPAGRPPHKTRQEISDNEHRLAMLQFAIADSPWFAISLVDMQRAGPSYTADTLAILRHELDPAELIFLMGSCRPGTSPTASLRKQSSASPNDPASRPISSRSTPRSRTRVAASISSRFP